MTGRDGIDEVQIAVDFGGWQTEVKGFCNYREVLEGTALWLLEPSGPTSRPF